MASWRDVVAYSRAFTSSPSDYVDGANRDEEVTYGVAKMLPVIVWDRDAGKRRVIPMRWGFPHAKDWRRPQPIHARSETIETTRAFAEAFRDGQRGVVVFQTFNE